MSKIIMSKTPWERCVYPALKAALEKTDYNQTTLAAATGISHQPLYKGRHGRDHSRPAGAGRLTGMTFRELFGECEGRR